jgi:hypothetical protein
MEERYLPPLRAEATLTEMQVRLIRLRLPRTSPLSTDQNIRQARKLAELLQQNIHAQCIDPRDKVYAFLGLATDCAGGAGIPADYSKSPVQLYINVVHFCNTIETELQFILTVRDMLRVNSIEVDYFVRSRSSPFLQLSIVQ